MRRSGIQAIAAGSVLVLTAATCARAADAPGQAATALDGLTVAVPRTPPAVVSTYPAAGVSVAPGTLVLKVSFDQSMDPDSWAYAKAAVGDYPQCLAKPRLLADARTFVLLCTTGESVSYSVALNAGAASGFTSIGHRSATPFELRFSTSSARPIRSLQEALSAAGLRPEDSPIEGAEQAAR